MATLAILCRGLSSGHDGGWYQPMTKMVSCHMVLMQFANDDAFAGDAAHGVGHVWVCHIGRRRSTSGCGLVSCRDPVSCPDGGDGQLAYRQQQGAGVIDSGR